MLSKHHRVTIICLVLFAALLFFFPFGDFPGWVYGLPLVIWLILTAIGSLYIRWQYHLPSLLRSNKTPADTISITFDDGPHPVYTAQVLDLLARFDAKATFFCIGAHVKDHPQLVQRIIDEGHTVGNHSYSHPYSFGFKGKKKVREELEACQAQVVKVTDKRMRMFRPPFGVTNPQIAKVVNEMGLTCIGWSIRSLDTLPMSEERIWSRIVSSIGSGEVLLLHDTSEKSICLLERLLVFLRDKGIQSIPVDELLMIEPYE